MILSMLKYYIESIISSKSRKRHKRIERENKWGKKFKKFLEDNPQAKLLGLSATPIRHDGANVVERILKDAVASQKSLLEAMEEGII